MKIINTTISSLTLISAYLIAKEFFNKKESILLAISIGLFPNIFSFSPYMMSENLFYPLFLFTIYLILKSYQKIIKQIGEVQLYKNEPTTKDSS